MMCGELTFRKFLENSLSFLNNFFYQLTTLEAYVPSWASQVGLVIKNLPAKAGDQEM